VAYVKGSFRPSATRRVLRPPAGQGRRGRLGRGQAVLARLPPLSRRVETGRLPPFTIASSNSPAPGRTVVVVGNERHVCGFLALADTVRPEAAAVRQLTALGVEPVVMSTGDISSLPLKRWAARWASRRSPRSCCQPTRSA
jgi:cation transport ATPase